MQELRSLLTLEQPLINAALLRHLETLPPLAYPAAAHLLGAGGKRLRPLLTLLVGRALGNNNEDLYTLGVAIEMLHAATLLHDDILDNAPLRRGQPTAHSLFGITQVILAGDALLAKALLMVSQLDDARLTKCISEAVMRTAEGEIAEFAAIRNISLLPEEYLHIITGKTAWMLQASCELAALYAGATASEVKAAARFGLELGIAFQLVDDALDFSPCAETGKPTGGDLREGKITPPLLHYLAALPPNERTPFKQKLADNLLTDEDITKASTDIFDHGYAQKAREQADSHLLCAKEALTALPKGKPRDVLEQMLTYVRTRKA